MKVKEKLKAKKYLKNKKINQLFATKNKRYEKKKDRNKL